MTHLELKRKDKSLTQKQVAEYIGITERALRNLENQKCKPSHEVMLKLCKLFNIEHGEVKGLFEPASGKQE